jgi:hypothetical protein
MHKTISLIIVCILMVFSANSVAATLQDASTACGAWDSTGPAAGVMGPWISRKMRLAS